MNTSHPVIKQLFVPLFILFIVTNCFCLLFTSWLMEKKIDSSVVIAANLLLFAIGIINGAIGIKAMKNPNPNVFIRSIMAGTFIKLLIIAAAVLIYFFAARENMNVYAILVGMGLYIPYTILEVKATLKINRRKDGSY